MKHLSASIEAGHLTNRGPATQRLEAEARRRLKLGRHVAIPACSGSAALHALLATYLMKGHDLPNGILVSAFGFPPILQGNWKQVTVTVSPRVSPYAWQWRLVGVQHIHNCSSGYLSGSQMTPGNGRCMSPSSLENSGRVRNVGKCTAYTSRLIAVLTCSLKPAWIGVSPGAK